MMKEKEIEVVVRLPEEEKPKASLLRLGLFFSGFIGGAVSMTQTFAEEIKKTFDPGEKLIKARFYLLE